MREIVKNTLLIGLGIAAYSRKRLTKVLNTLKTEGEALKEELPVIKRRWHKIETFSQRIDEIGEKIISRLNIATKKEVSELNKKIEKFLRLKSVAE